MRGPLPSDSFCTASMSYSVLIDSRPEKGKGRYYYLQKMKALLFPTKQETIFAFFFLGTIGMRARSISTVHEKERGPFKKILSRGTIVQCQGFLTPTQTKSEDPPNGSFVKSE